MMGRGLYTLYENLKVVLASKSHLRGAQNTRNGDLLCSSTLSM
jgi:hypothetical protein